MVNVRAGIVDVHGHITPPELFARLPMPPSLADIDGMISAKAEVGIETTIVGSPVGVGTMMRIPGWQGDEQTPDVLRGFHDWLATTVSKHAPALAAYAYTNPFGGSALLSYTASAVRDGGFVGLIVNSSVDGRYLDAPECDEFFAMVDELDVPILLHPPAEPVGSGALDDFRLVESVGRFNDVTTGLASLVWGGRLEQYPRLRVVAGMSGGAISLLADRLDKTFRPAHWQGAGGPPAGAGGGPPGGGGPPRYTDKITDLPSTYLKRIFTDTTSHSPAVLRANVAVMGPGQVMFGTDFPPASTPLNAAIGVVDSLGLSDDEADAVFGRTARTLFKL
jgi:predicted TIM-barrel fold metal-dependent hydrolase